MGCGLDIVERLVERMTSVLEVRVWAVKEDVVLGVKTLAEGTDWILRGAFGEVTRMHVFVEYNALEATVLAV